MDFRKKLILLLGIIALSALALVFASYSTTKDIHNRLIEVRALDNGIDALFDLNMLATELEVGSASRIRAQWRSIRKDIDEAISAVAGFGAVEQQVMAIQQRHGELDALAERLFERHSMARREGRRHAVQQLQIVTSSMLSETQILFDRIHSAMRSATLKFTVLMIFWGVMLVVAIIAIGLLVRHDVLAPLHGIRMDTEIIAAGNLNHKARLAGSRELVRLATAFNVMTESLSKTLVSKATLARNEERFRQFFEVGLVGNAIVSPEREWVLVNERLCSMLQYTDSELRQLNWETVTYEPDMALEKSLIEETLAGKRDGYNLDRRFVRKDGNVIHAKIAVRAVGDEAGGIAHLLVMVEDITERVHAMAQVLHSNRELEQFAYVASHDLQEPLRMVASFTELLEKKYGDQLQGDAKEFMGYIVDGAKRMQTLITDLLMYSRVGKKDDPMSVVDAMVVIETVKLNLSVAISESNTSFSCSELPKVIANATQLTQLFQNLIGNAIKFRRAQSPEVTVFAEADGAMIRFGVSDNGIGIDPKYGERIFQIFQRLHARSQYEGTGIGLAVCKKIVECHGGEIWFESQSGIGTTFYFTLKSASALKKPLDSIVDG